jgi:hypothetical protein
VRKLWTARVLSLLLAAALGVVVIEERNQQVRESEQLQRISAPAAPARLIDVEADDTGGPREISTAPYLHRPAERDARGGSRPPNPGR